MNTMEDVPTPTPENISLQVQMLAFRVLHLEKTIGRFSKVAWAILIAIAARFGLDISGVAP